MVCDQGCDRNVASERISLKVFVNFKPVLEVFGATAIHKGDFGESAEGQGTVRFLHNHL